MAELYSLDAKELQRFLERRRASPSFPLEMSLADNLAEILRKADRVLYEAKRSGRDCVMGCAVKTVAA